MRPENLLSILKATLKILNIQVDYHSNEPVKQFLKNAVQVSLPAKVFLHLSQLEKTERGIFCYVPGNQNIELWLEIGDTDRGDGWRKAMLQYADVKFILRYIENTRQINLRASG